MDIGFALNYQYLMEVDTTPNGAERTWAWAGPGIRTLTKGGDETKSEDVYYSNGGNTEVGVTGVSRNYEVEGDYLVGDPFQEYVRSIEDSAGPARKTRYRITGPDGRCIEAPCTITDIVAGGPGGDANAKSGFKCTINRDSDPVEVEKAKGTKLPEQVTCSAAPQVTTSKPGKLAPQVTPSEASARCLFAAEDTSIATVAADGTVTGVKEGKTRIAVKCAAKPSVSCVVEVNVTHGA